MRRNAARTSLFVFALTLVSAASLFAFTSVQKETVVAGAFVGGIPPGNGLKIHHNQLSPGSPVTKQFIILGEAGDETPVPPPPFTARVTPESDFGPLENRRIRVTVYYRFVTQEQFEGQESGPEASTLPSVEGPDPISFAFQIPESSFTTSAPILQYRLVAQRLQYVNGQQEVTVTTTLPATSSTSPEPWITVGARVNAATTFDILGGRLILPDANPVDSESAIDVPAGAFSSPTRVTLDEVPVDSSLLPAISAGGVRYFQVTIDQTMNEPAQITLLYPDFEFPLGANGIVDGTNIAVQNLRILQWDGFKWRRLGGVIDPRNNTIRAKFSTSGFFVIAAAAPLTAEERRPDEKIITPNGDGHNDVALFSVDTNETYKVDIFDINGHNVRSIMAGSSAGWDGRDDGGQVVESGVYIYQYEVNGKQVSGLIAVAK